MSKGYELPPGYSLVDSGSGGYQLPAGYSLADAPNRPRVAADAGDALLTNLPISGFTQDMARSGPAIAGATLGGAAGAPLGPLGVVGGATLGGAAGEAIRQFFSQLTAAKFPEQNLPVAGAGDILRNVGAEAIKQGAGAGLGEAVSAGAGAVAQKLAPGFLRNMAAIPEAAGKAVAEDPGILRRAPTDAQVGALYDTFHGASGTVSRKEFIAKQIDPVDTAERAMAGMKELWAKGQSGQQLTAQDLVNASQAARVIRDAKATGNEFARGVSSSADQMKGVFDQILESMHPEWSAARQAAWENNVASEFASRFPLNKNGSPNQLRGYLSLKGALAGAATGFGGAGAALAAGHAGMAAAAAAGGTAALLSPLAESPAVYGAAIKAATAVPAGVYQLGRQIGANVAISPLEASYMQGRTSP